MRLALGLAAVAIVATAGCGRKEPPRVPVGGSLLLQQKDGQMVPMAGAKLVLVPVVGADKTRLFPSARAGADGAFRLGTEGADDGAVEGEYVVTVEWKDRYKPKVDMMGRGEIDRGPDKLKGAYANQATSPLRATVAAGKDLKVVVPAP